MLNRCDFIGRLGNDPEVRYLNDGKAVANISIGCSEKWKDKQTGEQKESTEWVRGSAFGRLAEIIQQYCHKGDLVYISGKMQTRKYQAQDGTDRYATDISIRELKMLGGNSGGQSNSNQPVTQQSNGVNNHQDIDDYIPF